MTEQQETTHDKSSEELADDYIKELLADRKGLGEIVTVLRIQRESGIIRSAWPGAHRGDPHGRYTSAKEDTWPVLGLMDIIPVITKAYANQMICRHEVKQKTGEAIPMGSFTAQPGRCQRCGQYFSDD